MTAPARSTLALTTLALAVSLSACATRGARPGDAPPPPQITTVSTPAASSVAAPRSNEGPLSPVPGIPEPVIAVNAAGVGAGGVDAAAAFLNRGGLTGAASSNANGGPDMRGLARGEVAASALPPAEPESGVDAAGAPVDSLDPDAPQPNPEQAQLDLWQRVRDGFGMPDLRNDLVAEHERWYASRPDYVQRMTDRGGRYLYHIVEEVRRRGMPTELALLPFIESAYNPQAMSVAKASGMWQFIPSTGRDYALKQNLFRDDRRDVLASTRAALDYLARLNREFNDWRLSLAAYNWGEGNVRRAIARNQRAGLATEYESLTMPSETRHYLPKLQAVKNLVDAPSTFGLTLPALKNHPYFMSVAIKRDIDVALAARLAGLSVDEFKTLNPSMNKPVILAAGTPQVLLPYDNADDFVKRLEAHRGTLASWTAWVVPRTMRPTDAAKQLGISEAALREVNTIPPRMLIKAQSTLLVPRSQQRTVDVPEHVADNAHMLLAPDVPALKKVAVKARKGDTLASVAARYRVSVAQMAQWNRITTGTRLNAGQALVIYQANAPTAKARKGSVSRNLKVAAAKP
ncbi:MAG: transglycosylase SLT domain-containing protein [Leptothrix sp. (in: b-proteobacteria)]